MPSSLFHPEAEYYFHVIPGQWVAGAPLSLISYFIHKERICAGTTIERIFSFLRINTEDYMFKEIYNIKVLALFHVYYILPKLLNHVLVVFTEHLIFCVSLAQHQHIMNRENISQLRCVLQGDISHYFCFHRFDYEAYSFHLYS